MVFKRRDRRPVWRAVVEFVYPQGGWHRAFMYVRHRVHRLPDPPHKIARGIFAGVLTTFTPFYGLHFLVAAILARLMHGNIVAALLATFFGNPLTYFPIGVVSLKTGYFLMGKNPDKGDELHRSLGGKFVDAGHDLTDNFMTLFNGQTPDWTAWWVFFDQVFLPYLIGGLIPGTICALIMYYLSVPVIYAYKKRRKGLIKSKLAALKANAAVKAEAKAEAKEARAEAKAEAKEAKVEAREAKAAAKAEAKVAKAIAKIETQADDKTS